MKTISLLCPSRQRPKRFVAMRDSALQLARYPERVTCELGLDSDDPEMLAYTKAKRPEDWTRVYSGRPPVPVLFNRLAKSAMGSAKADILMLASDDVLFRSKNWDVQVEEALAGFSDGLALVVPEIGRPDDKADFWFVSRRWVEIVGYFAWAGDCGGLGPFEHFCADTVAERIAMAVGRRVDLSTVTIEHMHAKYGKANNDESYKSKRVRGPDGKTPSDRDIERLAALQPEIDAAVARVQAAIDAAAAAPAKGAAA